MAPRFHGDNAVIQLRELKARKAKFGFDGGSIGIKNVVEMGKFFETLENTWPGKYLAEEAGFGQPSLKIYTDDEDVANWIRLNSKLFF